MQISKATTRPLSPVRLAKKIRLSALAVVLASMTVVMLGYVFVDLPVIGYAGFGSFTHPFTFVGIAIAFVATLSQRPLKRSSVREVWLWRVLFLLAFVGPLLSLLNIRVFPLSFGEMGWNTSVSLLCLAFSMRMRSHGHQSVALVALGAVAVAPVIALNGYILGLGAFYGNMSPSTVMALLGLMAANAVRFTRHTLIKAILKNDRFSQILRAQILMWLLVSLAIPWAMRSASVDYNQVFAMIHTAEMLFVLGGLMLYNHRLAIVFEAASKANRLLRAEQLRDGLTGAASRVTAGEYFMQNAWRNHVAVVMADADNFKQVNDRWGHDVGDMALIEMVKHLRQGLRVNDHIVRWGGEEFLLMFPAQTEFDLVARCEQLRDAIKRGFEQNGDLPDISASFGAVLANPSADPELRNWIRSADQALLAAKSKGRDQVVFSRNGAIVPVRLEGAESLSKAADCVAA